MSVEFTSAACPFCEGEGGAYTPPQQWEQCGHCNGTGKIAVRVQPDSLFARAKMRLFSAETAILLIPVVITALIIYLILK